MAEGLLLEHLRETKKVRGLGVDRELSKSISCVTEKVPVYQEEILEALEKMRITLLIGSSFSRMVESVSEPERF